MGASSDTRYDFEDITGLLWIEIDLPVISSRPET